MNRNMQVIIEELESDLADVQNVVQLLAMSFISNEEDTHMVRSIHIIDKMLDNILHTNIVELKEQI